MGERDGEETGKRRGGASEGENNKEKEDKVFIEKERIEKSEERGEGVEIRLIYEEKK